MFKINSLFLISIDSLRLRFVYLQIQTHNVLFIVIRPESLLHMDFEDDVIVVNPPTVVGCCGTYLSGVIYHCRTMFHSNRVCYCQSGCNCRCPNGRTRYVDSWIYPTYKVMKIMHCKRRFVSNAEIADVVIVVGGISTASDITHQQKYQLPRRHRSIWGRFFPGG